MAIVQFYSLIHRGIFDQFNVKVYNIEDHDRELTIKRINIKKSLIGSVDDDDDDDDDMTIEVRIMCKTKLH